MDGQQQQQQQQQQEVSATPQQQRPQQLQHQQLLATNMNAAHSAIPSTPPTQTPQALASLPPGQHVAQSQPPSLQSAMPVAAYPPGQTPPKQTSSTVSSVSSVPGVGIPHSAAAGVPTPVQAVGAPMSTSALLANIGANTTTGLNDVPTSALLQRAALSQGQGGAQLAAAAAAPMPAAVSTPPPPAGMPASIPGTTFAPTSMVGANLPAQTTSASTLPPGAGAQVQQILAASQGHPRPVSSSPFPAHHQTPAAGGTTAGQTASRPIPPTVPQQQQQQAGQPGANFPSPASPAQHQQQPYPPPPPPGVAVMRTGPDVVGAPSATLPRQSMAGQFPSGASMPQIQPAPSAQPPTPLATMIKVEAPTGTGVGMGTPSGTGGSTPAGETPKSNQVSVTSYDQGERSGGGGGGSGSGGAAGAGPSGPAAESAPSQIFKATYSGVPVFEMICKGVAVMRRRSDSYLNATQILKVAEFDKPQRTRILEREVQKGEHEKVQGGYGKYQGTWVPFDRGLQLCQEYNVLNLLKPLLEYEMKSSPPLAPKHITAASNRPRKPREPRAAGEAGGTKVKKERLKKTPQILPKPGVYPPMATGGEGGPEIGSQQYLDDFDDSTSSASDMEEDADVHSMMSDNVSVDETMSVVSAQSRTPSPLESRHDVSSSDVSEGEGQGRGGQGGYSRRRRSRSADHSPLTRKRYARPGDELFVGYHGHQRGNQGQQDVDMESRDGEESRSHLSPDPSPRGRSRSRTRATEESATGEWPESGAGGEGDQAEGDGGSRTGAPGGRYAQTLLNYFISDSQALPKILTNPPADLDFDVIIDEEGHTPLHWAVAMARTKIVRLLVQHGADIYRVNNQGQTALMRSVLFTNNFDLKTFPTLLEILQKTIFTIDKNDQTVFHHVAATAGMRGKVHASRYYMECLLEKLANHPTELATIINVRDVVGDTALTIAARIGNKKVVRLLMEAGADPKIRNKSGKNAEDYLAEHDQFPQLQQQQQQQGQTSIGQRQEGSSLKPGQRPSGLSPPSYAPPAHLQLQQQQQQQQQQQPSPLQSQPHRTDSISPQTARQYGVDPSGRAGYAPGVGGGAGMGQQQQQRMPPLMNPFQVGHPPQMGGPGVSTLYKNLREANSWPGYVAADTSRPGSRATSVERTFAGATGVAGASGAGGGGGGGGGASNNNNSGLRRVIPTVTDLFEQLTQSYEKDLFEREKDLVDARNMLHGIQSDIREGQRTIEELRAKTAHGQQTEEQIRTLEGMVRQEMNMRQRLRLEELVAEEEGKLIQAYEQKKQQEEADGAGKGAGNDLERCEQLEREAREAQQQLSELQRQRNEQLDAIVKLKSQQGKRRHEYKRLIALCCNVSIDEVDGLLGPMLNALGSDDMVLE